MKQEDKELLLKDLSARLSYDVIVYDYDKEETREMGIGTLHDIMFNDLECKPYLRPISSMTEEELNEYRSYCRYHNIKGTVVYEDTYKSFDWLNKKMFDYRNLIPKGLALEAPKDMYK